MTNKQKPIKYLITAECWQANPNHGIMRGAPERLRHLKFEVVKTIYPHHAQQRANDLGHDFRLKIIKDLTRQVWEGYDKGWRVVPPKGLSPVTIKVERYRYRPRKAVLLGSDITAHNAGEKQAIGYVRWLAGRDKIEIYSGYSCKTRCDWRDVDIPGKTVGRHYYNGTRQVQATEKRISAVEHGHEEEVFKIRKDGSRGAFLYKQFVCDVRIEIPNWDFVPSCTDETLPIFDRDAMREFAKRIGTTACL